MRRTRITKLHPELTKQVLNHVLRVCRHGEVYEVREEMWARTYRYNVSSGKRMALLHYTQHMLSHMHIAGNTAIVSSDAQQTKC
jgi:hypothetical protein